MSTQAHRITVQDNDPLIHMAIPDELYHDLLIHAEMADRSLNTEILTRLSMSLRQEGEKSTEQWLKLIFGES